MENKIQLIWIPNHPEHEWWPGEVTGEEGDKFFIVADDKSNQFKIEKSKVIQVDPACLTSVPDLLLLEDLNEGSLLHNIRMRYLQDEIYTAIGGPIIVSVNPYKLLPIYGKDIAAKYKKDITQMRLGNLNPHDVDPHLYKIAENSYQSLLETKKSQSIIISGESGSGKTEAAKVILKYLTQTSHQEGTAKIQAAENAIEEKVLDSNPILEAFGNAKTIRNDNSSRFGKFIEVNFDKSGRIKSANIVNYLLEKSRLVFQQPGERNYHIFYQLCYGATNQERELYKIGSPEDYKYLSRDKDEETDENMNDSEDFKQTRECINALGFSEDEKDQIFRVVAGIMHLGNVEFTLKANTNSEAADMSKDSYEYIERAAKMFGLPVQDLGNVCLQKIIPMPNVTEVVKKEFKVDEAYKIKDGLVKDSYGRFFDWLVYKVNQSISASSNIKEKSKFVLGILDIFGFEIFQTNSFEQLCINYTNEKLQQHFNNHIFKIEQEEYQREGINWSSVSFADNLQTISLIEHPTNSLFSLLEEECLIPKGSDTNFLNKVYLKLGSSRAMCARNNRQQTLFGIKHYAGEVYYDSTNFLEKNKDTVNSDFVNLFLQSDNNLLKLLYSPGNTFSQRGISGAKANKPNEPQKAAQTGSIKGATLTAKFKTQLSELLDALNDTNPAYIRCIKPNSIKSPGVFDSIDVMRQLKCAGILEAIKIRKNGFPIRKTHKDFLAKYGRILPEVGSAASLNNLQLFFNKLMDRKGVGDKLKNLWAVGKTKVFMKEEAVVILDHELYLAVKKFVKRIQNFGRKIVLRIRWKRLCAFIHLKWNVKRVLLRKFKKKVVDHWKRKMALKIWKNWKIFKYNRKTEQRKAKWRNAIAQLKRNKQVMGDVQVSDSANAPIFQNQAFKLDDSFSGTPVSGALKRGSKKGRDSANMDGPMKDLLKKMQEELEELRHENAELKSRGTTRVSRLGNEIYDRIAQQFGNNGIDMEGLLKDPELDQASRDKYNDRIDELQRTIFEKDSSMETLNAKVQYLTKSYETLEKENKYLKDDIKKRENILQQKLQLEIDIKKYQRQNENLNNRIEYLEGDLQSTKDKIKEKDEKVAQANDKTRKLQLSYEELQIKFQALKEQEDFFRKEAARKDLELREKIDHLSQVEDKYKAENDKLKLSSLSNIELSNSQASTPIRARNENLGETSFSDNMMNNEQMEEFQQTISQKNIKLFNLTKENQISKEINQTLVKLLKLKNVQIQMIKIVNNEQDANKKADAQSNLEKFQNEEKKLLRMLDSLMKQYETLETKK